MNRDDFAMLLGMAVKACKRELPAEAGEALWELYGNESVGTWKQATRLVAVGGRWPSGEGWTKIVKDAKTSPATGTSKGIPGKACECGGHLIVPPPESRLPRGYHWPTQMIPPAITNSVRLGAEDRSLNPHRWSVAMTRVCDTCGTEHVVQTEDVAFTRQDGTRGMVRRGDVKRLDLKPVTEPPDSDAVPHLSEAPL